VSDLAGVTRAELFKLAKRPSAWVLLIAAIVLNQIFSYLIPFLSYVGNGQLDEGATKADLLASTLPPQLIGNTISGFPVFAGALAMVLGALVAGSEYGWGTVKAQLTQGPGRATVMIGQLLAIAVAALVGVLAQLGLGAVTSSAIALGESRSITFPSVGTVASGAAVGWLILLMWALLGAALGILLRGLALPIGLGAVWVLGVENLISGMAGSVLSALQPVRDVLPGVNAGSLVTAVIPARVLDPPPGVNSSVGEVRSLVTLAVYVVLSAVVAVVATRRRDVG
jgi:ABC-type transport system involved in multi-copper enzyme maturation permease subunit